MKQAQCEAQKRINELHQLSQKLRTAKDVQGVLRCKVLIAYYKGMGEKVIVASFGISDKSLKHRSRPTRGSAP